MIQIPTIADIRDQIITSIEAKIGQTTPVAPKAFFRVLATALAGVISLFYRVARWGYDQIFPQTADDESLVKIGQNYGVIRKSPVSAVLTATATGDNGVSINSGTLWTYGNFVFSQVSTVTISGGTAMISVTALTAGSSSNVSTSEKISLVTPIAGVARDATVTGTATQGEDIEDIEDFRVRVITRLSTRPQGGAVPDYVLWALEVPGIVKAFAFRTTPSPTSATVSVYTLQSLTSNRIPDSSKLLEVKTYLNSPERKPLCTEVLAPPMTEKVLNFTISSVFPDTSPIRAAIENSISSYLLKAFPKQYADELFSTSIVSLSELYKEASSAGATIISMTMRLDGAVSDIISYTLDESEIIKLGTISWPT